MKATRLLLVCLVGMFRLGCLSAQLPEWANGIEQKDLGDQSKILYQHCDSLNNAIASKIGDKDGLLREFFSQARYYSSYTKEGQDVRSTAEFDRTVYRIAEWLINNGAEINGNKKGTPIKEAAQNDLPITVVMLLWNGCEVKDDDAEYVFMCGIKYGSMAILNDDKLKKVHSNLSAKLKIPYGSEYPLFYAIDAHQSVSVEWLLQHGADPKIIDEQGNTLLHRTVSPKEDELTQKQIDDIQKIIDLLIHAGVDLKAKNNGGHSALNYANYDQIKKYLEEKISTMSKNVKKLNVYDKYTCKRVALFINGKPQDVDAIVITCLSALVQQASFLIVSAPVLAKIYKNESSKKNLTGWSFYKNPSSNAFFLCVPPSIKNFDASKDLAEFGFRSDLKKEELKVYPCILKDETDETGLGDFFDKGKGLFESGSEPWNVYLVGHGGSGWIAGMPINIFKDFLFFLNGTIKESESLHRIKTNFLFYQTCFGGGMNSITPYLSKIDIDNGKKRAGGKIIHAKMPDVLSFIIAEGATTDETTLAVTGSVYEPLVDYVDFFDRLETIFVGGSKIADKKDPWAYVLETVTPKEAKRLSTETPLIRFPGSGVFQSTEIDKKVFTLTHSRLMKYVYDDQNIVIDKDKEVLLLYPAIIPQKIVFKNYVKIISMNPEYAVHFFENIQFDNINYWPSFWPQYNGQKRIIIVKDAHDSDNQVKNWFLTWSNKDYIMQNVKNVTKDTLTRDRSKIWPYVILNDYAAFKPTLSDIQGQPLAVWQQNPETLVAFIKKRCFNELPDTDQLTSAVEDIEQKYFSQKNLKLKERQEAITKKYKEMMALKDSALEKKIEAVLNAKIENVVDRFAQLQDREIVRSVLGKKIKDTKDNAVQKKYQNLLEKLSGSKVVQSESPLSDLSTAFTKLSGALKKFAGSLRLIES